MPLGNFYFIKNKNSIISCSHDKTIKVYQLPLYFPSQMMRGDHLIEKKDLGLKEEKTKNDKSKDSKYSLENRILNKAEAIKLKNNQIEYDELQQKCEDLIGWDN